MTTRIIAVPARTPSRLAGFAVGNLTDHQYDVQAYGCIMKSDVTLIYPEPGRLVTVSLRVKF